MRAWISGRTPGRDALSFGEADMPAPKDGFLSVRVSHAALNYSDLLMIDDAYQVRPDRPFVPGQEIVGTVTEAAHGFAEGEAVAGKILWGGFAEQALLRADMAIRVPEGFGRAQAAALPVSYVTALVGLDHCARVQPGEYVLVHAAAGGVGLAAVEIAAARGAHVIATAGSQDKLDTAIAHGAAAGVNYRDSDWYKEVKTLTDGRGADVIFDPVGGETGENSLRCIARQGRYLVVGFASGRMPKLAANRLLLKRASAIGVYWNHDEDPEMLAGVTRDLEKLVAAGKIAPVIDDRHALADLPAALDDLANRRVTGKMVLRVGREDAR